MRVMADANIIVSAILFPKSVIANVLKHVIDNYSLVLSKYTIYEVEDVFNEKFPQRITEMKNFLQKIPYELFTLKKTKTKKYPNIRDIDDLPVLANAIESKVDLLITGDKDFDDVLIKRPKIINLRKYINEYM
jgi:putative toxin-antitoxin system toxin component, PIN family